MEGGGNLCVNEGYHDLQRKIAKTVGPAQGHNGTGTH